MTQKSFPKIKILLPYLGFLTLFTFFYYLTREVIKKETLFFDLQVNSWILGFRDNFLTKVMIFVSDFSLNVGFILVAFLVIYFVIKRHFRTAFNLSLSTILANIIFYALKNIVHRDRPELTFRLIQESNFSFPSGHATIAFTIYPILAILILKTNLNKPLKYIFSTILVLFPFVVGFSRLYLGVHYITDVFAGMVLGLSITAIFFFVEKESLKPQITNFCSQNHDGKNSL